MLTEKIKELVNNSEFPQLQKNVMNGFIDRAVVFQVNFCGRKKEKMPHRTTNYFHIEVFTLPVKALVPLAPLLMLLSLFTYSTSSIRLALP